MGSSRSVHLVPCCGDEGSIVRPAAHGEGVSSPRRHVGTGLLRNRTKMDLEMN